MSTFNVRAGTKVPCIGNAPTHFTASALTLHQPEMHRRKRKRIFVAIHRWFRVHRVVARHDSVEQRAMRACSSSVLCREPGRHFRKRESDPGYRRIATTLNRRIARRSGERDQRNRLDGCTHLAGTFVAVPPDECQRPRSAIDTPLKRPHDTSNGSTRRAIFGPRKPAGLPHDGCHRSAICRRRQYMA
jgi:hypothetical protein